MNLKNSKKIIPSAMLGLVLMNAISPAFANNTEIDINSFQNAQSMVINQEIKQNKNPEKEFDSLNYFQENVTGRYVEVEEVLKNGGVFHNPLNKEEIILINIDEKVEVLSEKFKNKEDYLFSKAIEEEAKSIFEKSEIARSFSYITEEEKENSPDYLHINTFQAETFAIDLTLSNLKQENEKYGKIFVLYHEFAHSMSSMENYQKSKNYRNLNDFKSVNIAESFSDIVGSVAVFKNMEKEKEGKELEDDFRNFLTSLVIKRVVDTKQVKNTHDITDPHYTELPLFILYKLNERNPDLLKDIDMKEAEQLAATITNRTLNQEEVYDIVFNDKIEEVNSSVEMKRSIVKTLNEEVLPEIESMITVNEKGKVSFDYNPEVESKILGKKPKTYKLN